MVQIRLDANTVGWICSATAEILFNSVSAQNFSFNASAAAKAEFHPISEPWRFAPQKPVVLVIRIGVTITATAKMYSGDYVQGVLTFSFEAVNASDRDAVLSFSCCKMTETPVGNWESF